LRYVSISILLFCQEPQLGGRVPLIVNGLSEAILHKHSPPENKNVRNGPESVFRHLKKGGEKGGGLP
jgi:hypothetical protein